MQVLSLILQLASLITGQINSLVAINGISGYPFHTPWSLDPNCTSMQVKICNQLDMSGRAVITIQNDTGWPHGFMERLDQGSMVGKVTDVLEVAPSYQSDSDVGAVVGQVSSENIFDDTDLQEWKRLLTESFSHIDLPSRQKDLIDQPLCDYHDVFVLSEGEHERKLISIWNRSQDMKDPLDNTLVEYLTQLEKKWQGSWRRCKRGQWYSPPSHHRSNPVVLVRKKEMAPIGFA